MTRALSLLLCLLSMSCGVLDAAGVHDPLYEDHIACGNGGLLAGPDDCDCSEESFLVGTAPEARCPDGPTEEFSCQEDSEGGGCACQRLSCLQDTNTQCSCGEALLQADNIQGAPQCDDFGPCTESDSCTATHCCLETLTISHYANCTCGFLPCDDSDPDVEEVDHCDVATVRARIATFGESVDSCTN